MKKILSILITLTTLISAQNMNGEEILEHMDINREYKTIAYTGEMQIHFDGDVRIKTMKSIGMSADEDKAVVEFTNVEDEGTKYLMLGKELWIYFPQEDDVVKISGHMLKEGMMGSDVSYEDALESDKLSDKYTIVLDGEETIDERVCYVISLDAKVRNVPYYKRKMWVDTEKFIVLKEDMYSKSGKLLKESHALETIKIDGRWFVTSSELINKTRKNSKTVFTMIDISFDEKVEESMFSMRYLRR